MPQLYTGKKTEPGLSEGDGVLFSSPAGDRGVGGQVLPVEALLEVGAFFVSDVTWEFDGTGPPWWTQGFWKPPPTVWERLAGEDTF